jgi:hypothetical protein
VDGAWEAVVEELTLMLMYLTAWEEDEKILPPGADVADAGLRTWKGYRFEVLDRFAEADLTLGSKRAKSVHLTETAEEKAQALLQEHGLGDADPW